MAYLLHIESSGSVCSVALSKDDTLIAIKETEAFNTHAQNLLLFCDEVIREAGIKKKDLDAVAISAGPGSYTGLRIGTATAKAICYSLDIPLIAVSTLKSLAFAAQNAKPNAPFYVPFIDARRKEVYTATYDQHLNEIEKEKAVDFKTSELEYPKQSLFFGNGAQKLEAEIEKAGGEMLNNINLSAKNLISLSFSAFSIKHFVNIPYFVPNYIKNFQLFK